LPLLSLQNSSGNLEQLLLQPGVIGQSVVVGSRVLTLDYQN